MSLTCRPEGVASRAGHAVYVDPGSARASCTISQGGCRARRGHHVVQQGDVQAIKPAGGEKSVADIGGTCTGCERALPCCIACSLERTGIDRPSQPVVKPGGNALGLIESASPESCRVQGYRRHDVGSACIGSIGDAFCQEISEYARVCPVASVFEIRDQSGNRLVI